jgi:RHS repeat-associated protein
VTSSNGYDGTKDISYTGKEEDATGLYYFNARYYDPSIGRFITEDPARDGINWYVYCANNPLSYTDPTGLDCGNPGNDGIDENGNPFRVTGYTVVTDGNDICVTITTKPGSPTSDAQRESMKSSPSKEESDIILVKDHKVVGSKIEGGVPSGFDPFANIAKAKSMSPFDFYNYVKNHGAWDYKQLSTDYRAFGNWNYGLTGRAFGWPSNILLRMAGYAQVKAGTSEPQWGNPVGGPPYGDDPADQAVITSGMSFYDQAY